uniref:dUTPase-like domain-containing protein n=1 Tax=Pelusios castaneus TaxID=367368 RepID=A0A8C8RK42_9SAUR
GPAELLPPTPDLTLTAPAAATIPVRRLRAATSGSASLDLILQTDTDFQLPGEVHVVPTQVKGPLPPHVVGLILPRSHAGRKGFFVIPGVVDADYSGVLKVQVWTNLPQQLSKGSSVAQLILLPSLVPGAEHRERGDGGFGKSGIKELHSIFILKFYKKKKSLSISHPTMGNIRI